jgi:ring-1,2-phenylacetyl-CoA epoxidase subunit PaaD
VSAVRAAAGAGSAQAEPADRALLDVVSAVLDPELRVVSIAELGILRDVSVDEGRVVVTITPTYSGCPAMDAIRADIETALHRAGHGEVEVRTVLSPAWSTDWITESGRDKLAEAGIAPPGHTATRLVLTVRCPRCGSPDTEQLSRFGSTACKALWRCRACQEPFEAVKAI